MLMLNFFHKFTIGYFLAANLGFNFLGTHCITVFTMAHSIKAKSFNLGTLNIKIHIILYS